MSSWSLLLALSGWRYDACARELRVAPAVTPEAFRSLFVASEGWGSLQQSRAGKTQRNELRVVEGALRLARLELRLAGARSGVRVRASLRGRPVRIASSLSGADLTVAFPGDVEVAAGDVLAVTVG
jgi:hypothetical protein